MVLCLAARLGRNLRFRRNRSCQRLGPASTCRSFGKVRHNSRRPPSEGYQRNNQGIRLQWLVIGLLEACRSPRGRRHLHASIRRIRGMARRSIDHQSSEYYSYTTMGMSHTR